MRPREGLRLAGLCAQCEMTLVRRDRVAGPLLAQAARAAPDGTALTALSLAARIMRALEHTSGEAETEAARKVAQALTRLAAQEAQAAALAGLDPEAPRGPADPA